MRLIVTNVTRSVVCLCVCLLGMQISLAQTAKPIEMLLGGWLTWAQEITIGWGLWCPW